MKKSDLKNKMVVETRDKERYLVVGSQIIRKGGYTELYHYNGDLTNKEHKGLDIIRVYDEIYRLSRIESDELELLWERKWTPKYDEVYYTVDLGDEEGYIEWIWDNAPCDIVSLNNGVVFRTKEEAIECANKMLEAIKEEK